MSKIIIDGVEYQPVNPKSTDCTDPLRDHLVGKYVIIRTINEGINAGEVVAVSPSGIAVKGARRIYYHRPKDTKMSWYEGVALTGLSEDSKVAPPVDKTISEKWSATECTDEAKNSIINHPNHEQA